MLGLATRWRIRVPVTELMRVSAITIAASSTLDGGRERSPLTRGISEGRVLSTGNENARLLDSEYRDVEYSRRRLSTLNRYLE